MILLANISTSLEIAKGNQANHKAYHILWSREIIPTSRVSLASTLCTQGLFTPVVGAA